MTNITELAQRMSIERIKQIALGGTPTMGEREGLAITALHFAEELKIATDAFQAAGLAQLAAEEALEKAQTINAAAEKLVRCKGRYHSEQNYRALAALFGVTTPDLPPLEHENVHYADAAEMEIEALRQRIAELESHTVTAAAADVLAERKRQVTAEGWTPGHDDEYEHGELADAAGCYALSSELFDCAGEPPRPWPWPDEWWNPTNRRRDLVKA